MTKAGKARGFQDWAAKTEVIYWADTGGNDAYGARCRKCFRTSGPRFDSRDDAAAWKCPGPHCQDESP